ncbi:MAG TPA: PQQ-binding-like beta-propeller repeat protein [Planctomycetota bacterium]|nr:PQQ-binding-like beta-propeller repeat protein [Planctomycetota bacterium]
MNRAFRSLIALLVLTPVSLRADDWPMFGGHPDRNRVAHEKGLPTTFGPENARWVADIGDQTYGHPTVSGGRVFIGTNNSKPRDPSVTGDRGVLMCFSAEDGKFLWQAVHEKLPGKTAEDWEYTGLPSTACVEGDLVYYVSNRAELVCRAAGDGKLVWLLDMKKDLHVQPFQASASSPLVVGDLVFATTGNSLDEKTNKVKNPDAPSFIAVDRKTGKVAWKDNSPGARVVWGQWGSPAYSVVDGRPQIVFPGGDGWLYSFDPSSGKLLWKFNCKSYEKPPAEGESPSKIQLPATPVFAGPRVLIPVGIDVDSNDKGCLWAIDARKSGDVTSSAELWRLPGESFGLSFSSVTVQDGLVYAVEQAGYLDCIELESGKIVWKHDFLASLHGPVLLADGKLYFKTGDGEILVLQAGREKKILAKNDKFDHLDSGSLVVANGVLYFTGQSKMSGVGKLYAVAAGK